ncbi:glycosyltransferase family 2 protein [Gemmatimonas sp.]|uniref:glycosyltransferase family 2 protein n=1 Tax=Gemmatimonas sp. TaxID=1962908 RepID=UPI003983CB7D
MADTSVVVAAWGNEALLRQCLRHLDAERGRSTASVEVIAATSFPANVTTRLAAEFPWARVESVPNGTVFTLRARGVALARGALVAIIEDHAVVAPGWLSALQQAHMKGHGVLGGPVDNGRDGSVVDWALYFVEYGMYTPPAVAGEVAAVSGVNAAYDATLLRACCDIWQCAFHENEVNDALAAMGQRPWMVPTAVVSSHLPMSFGAAVAHLFAGGRQFAGYRAAPATSGSRALRVLASPAIPFLLFARLVQRIRVRRPDRLAWLVRSAGATFVMLSAWAAGECVGYALPLTPREARREVRRV